LKTYNEMLLSTPFMINGRLESESFALRPISPPNHMPRYEEFQYTSVFRSMFVLSLTVEVDSINPLGVDNKSLGPYHKTPLEIADMDGVRALKVFRNFLSLHYGKIFFDHGVTRINDHFSLPNINYFIPLKNARHPVCNMLDRLDFSQSGELSNSEDSLKRLGVLLKKGTNKNKDFLKSLNLYYNALEQYNINETLSFMLFVTSIETLTHKYSKKSNITSRNLDSDDYFFTKIINIIETDVGQSENRDFLKGFVLERYKVKMKFVDFVLQFLNENFYEIWEDRGIDRSAISKEEIEELLNRIYNLRSNYLHRGEDISIEIKLYSLLILIERITRFILIKVFDELTA
jgi:hypothetical protein